MTLEFKQDDRPLKVSTPFGDNVVVCESFSGEERISGLFKFNLELISLEAGLDPVDVIGQSVDVEVETADGEWRVFNGICRSFQYKGGDDRASSYHMEIVPKLWLLTKRSNCKVHESEGGQSAQDIVSAVLDEYGITHEWQMDGTPPSREYCIQYRETDLEFVERLLGEEGVFYYFTHDSGDHNMVLSDKSDGCYTCAEAEVNLRENMSGSDSLDHLGSWQRSKEMISGKYSHADYDFTDPQGKDALLKEPESVVTDIPSSSLSIYDYAGASVDPDVIENRAKARMEAEEATHEVLFSSSDRRSFGAGGKFTVAEHYNDNAAGTEWILTHVQHRASSAGYVASGGAASSVYSNTFRAIPSDRVPRPQFTRTKPQIFGVQSAIVTGPSGEEIHTDEHGRIKIQFQWDQLGPNDDTSSCWVRCMTPWAGTNWGMIAIPRVGQEVVVNFLNGDLDRPIVMGMMYNGDNMPPYGLPDNKTQTGIKTRSTTEGSDDNFNEIRFEDLKDSEQIYIHAEKDYDCVIENNETRMVGFEKMDPGDQSTEIYNNQNLIVGVGSGEGSQTEEIEVDRDITINTGNDTLTVSEGDQEINIAQGDQNVNIDQGDQNITLGMGSQTTEISQGDQSTTAGLGSISFEAMQKIELKVGSNKITIEQSGITIKGIQVKIKGDAMAEMKSAMTTVKGDAMLTAKGGITMIN